MVENIGLICCRGGSKGIPGKNIRKFLGLPLLSWVAEAALSSCIFDRVILSTDSEEIANVGIKLGLEVPILRPRHLATDNADQFDAHEHMFDHIKINDENSNVCILNNNPFITTNIITEAFANFEKYMGTRLVLDSLEVPGDYLYFRQVYLKDGHMYMKFKKEFMESKINRQEAGKSFVAINNIRFGKPSFLTSYEAFKNEVVNCGFIPVFLPKMNNFDLDDLDDWAIAEAVMEHINESKKKNERN